jgi:microcin C transport system substrate-binding protein
MGDGLRFPGVTQGHDRQGPAPRRQSRTGQAFIFNLRREKFQDPRVREAIGLMFNFEWSNQTLFYGLYDRINSVWENTDMAATGTPTPEEAALLQPLVDEGLLPAAILTDEAVMAPVSSRQRQLDRKNLRKASALLDEAGWVVATTACAAMPRARRCGAGIPERQPAVRAHHRALCRKPARWASMPAEIVDEAQLRTRIRPKFDFDAITDNAVGGLSAGGRAEAVLGSVTKDNVQSSTAWAEVPAVDRLMDMVEAPRRAKSWCIRCKALDRVLRSIGFWVPQWYKASHTVAYYDMYEHPRRCRPMLWANWILVVQRRKGRRAEGRRGA